MTRVFYVPLQSNMRVEWTPNKSQHTKLILEQKILASLLPGFELATLWSRVWHSYQQAIPCVCVIALERTSVDPVHVRKKAAQVCYCFSAPFGKCKCHPSLYMRVFVCMCMCVCMCVCWWQNPCMCMCICVGVGGEGNKSLEIGKRQRVWLIDF